MVAIDTSMPDAAPASRAATGAPQPNINTNPAQPSQPPPSSKKRHHPSKPSKNPTLAQFTIPNPRWSYIRLQHLSSSAPNTSSQPPLDTLTAHLHLQSSLSQFLGLHGSATPIDILKLEGQEVWIRVPSEDRSAIVAAVGGWVGKGGEGWRVRGWSSWSARAVGREGGEGLFG